MKKGKSFKKNDEEVFGQGDAYQMNTHKNERCCYRNSLNMVIQIASSILMNDIKYDGEMKAEKLIEAVEKYSPPEASYGEMISNNCAHSVNTSKCYQRRYSILLWALFYNYSAVHEVFDKTCNASDSLCFFDSLMFQFTFEQEKNPRWSRMMERYAEHENISKGKDLWTTFIGERKTFFKVPLCPQTHFCSMDELADHMDEVDRCDAKKK
ncbi:hypothetical protein FACS189472_13650 [Alphaproteobacteria bacterium]|nr:hypothetical protein FACS189472_13650 [Alphaproteobacteria bacterium]